MLEISLNIILLLFLPFLFSGIINRIKAFWAGRQGPPLAQPWYDFIKLLRKGEVVSRTTSLIFRLGPSVAFASVLTAGLLVPIVNHKAVINFDGNFIFFAYILGLGRFFTVIAAMDTGSSFEGMGASREVTFSALAEPAFFLLIASLAMISGITSFEQMLSFIPKTDGVGYLVFALAGLILFLFMLVEGCRVPIDDPNTHLELTMIHEVMVLDNSGPDLALINYGAALKLVVFGSLIAGMIIPPQLHPVIFLFLYVGIIVSLAIAVGCVESLIARLRMPYVPQLLLSMTSLALIVFSTLIMFIMKGVQ